MGIVFRLVGLPFAVIGGTIDIAHEGIGIAADSVAKKRRQRNDSNRPTRQYPSSGQCPNCTNCKSAISLKASNYHRTGPIQSSECPTEVSAQSQSENCRVYPAYAPLRRGPRTELPIHEPNLHSAELSACETSPPELDSHGPTSLPVELLSQRYSARAEPGGIGDSISDDRNKLHAESIEVERQAKSGSVRRIAGRVLSVSSSAAVSSLTLGLL